MINLKKITNKISSLKSVFTSAEKYNEIVDEFTKVDSRIEELEASSGGTTDLFTNTTASKFVKTNSTNDGLESTDLFENTNASQFVKTNSTNDGIVSTNLFANTSGSQFIKTNSGNNGLQSVNLFSDTTANKAVKANSTNTGLEDLPISIDETNRKIFIGENFINSDTISANCTIISGSQYAANAINSSTGKNDIIAIGASSINRSNMSTIGSNIIFTFLKYGQHINGFNCAEVSGSVSYPIPQLGLTSFINSSTSSVTVTFTGAISTLITEFSINTSYATVSFVVNNLKATTGNNFTLVFSDPSISVNGTDSLVVSSGTVGKFELYMYNDGVGEYKGKVCRVY